MVVNDQTPPKCNVQCYYIYIPDDVTSLALIARKNTAAAGIEYSGKVGNCQVNEMSCGLEKRNEK